MKITGKIVHGKGRGRSLGFPTLNIEGSFPSLEQGVYAVRVKLSTGPSFFRAALHYGPQPSFDDSTVRMEVFLVDFDAEVYGKTVELEIVQKIRETQKFPHPAALKAQIEKDVNCIKKLL